MPEDILDRIRQRAHAIWEEQGCPDGMADAHWSQASAEVGGLATPAPRKKKAVAAAATGTTKRRAAPKAKATVGA